MASNDDGNGAATADSNQPDPKDFADIWVAGGPSPPTLPRPPRPALISAETQRFSNSSAGHDEKKMADSEEGQHQQPPHHGSILRKGKKIEGGNHHDVKVSFNNSSSLLQGHKQAEENVRFVLSDLSEATPPPDEISASAGATKVDQSDDAWNDAADDSEIYSLNDLLETTKESPDEAAVLFKLERKKFVKPKDAVFDVTQDNMLPRVPDELLMNLQKHESEPQNNDDDDDSKDPDLAESKDVVHGDSDDLRSLTRRLAEITGNLDSGAGGGAEVTRLSLSRSRTSGSVGGGGIDRLKLFRNRSGVSQSDGSRRSIDFNGNEADGEAHVKLSRAGVDRYYNNAALIFPTELSRSDSARMSGGSHDIESAGVEDDDDPSSKKKGKPRTGMGVIHRIGQARRRAKVDFDFFVEFMEPHKRTIWSTFVQVTWYIMVPSLVLAAILFYGFDNPSSGYALTPCSNLTVTTPNNPFPGLGRQVERTRPPSPAPSPPTGVNETYAPTASNAPSTAPTKTPTYSIFDKDKDVPLCIDEEKSLEEASVSWWIIFLGCRQVVMLCVSIFLQLLVIDFFTLRTRFFPKVLGTQMSLAIAQSKGWPFVLLMWALLDLLFLYGDRRVARHWLYWQKLIDLMNSTNPSGNVTDHDRYKLIIYLSIGLSVAVTIKRMLIGNFVGKRVVVNYREDLSKIIKKCLLISEVAALSAFPHRPSERKTIVKKYDGFGRMYVAPLGRKTSSDDGSDEGDESNVLNPSPFGRSANSRISSFSGSNVESEILELLDEWEEPELEQENLQNVKTTDVLYFRRALGFIDNEFPFSPAFGRASTRDECIRSSQTVFEKLQTGRRKVINFKAICEITKGDDGSLDKMKMRDLIKVFRPNRLGEISKMEFVQSVDSVYKQLRLLLANIRNSSQIDNAYERIVNTFFYVIFGFIVLASFGLDINSIFLLLSSLLVSFAFMIGTASSKYLEGILLILARKPYNIGDRVVFLDPNAAMNTNGPPAGGWIVEQVDLYTTTVRLGTTREYATFANGSLANSRIINMKRSDKPNIFMYLKFTTNVTKEKLEAFKAEMTKFIKDKPREWIRINGFRCTRVEIEQQYLEFVIIVQHRESWQSFSTIQDSQGEVYIHALHLQKELRMEYVAPKVPVEMLGGPPSRSSFFEGLKPLATNVASFGVEGKNKIV